MPQLIEPTDSIQVVQVPILIFGPPGVGKTALAQTAEEPLTLDFDQGIHRTANRRRALRFSGWQDNVNAAGPKGEYTIPNANGIPQVIPYSSLVIDTGGRALDTMVPEILKENPKNGYAGNLTPQGWGVLGGRFTMWMKTVAQWGKQIVMVCHQEEAKNAAGESYFLPDLPGKMSYKEIHKIFDLIGRISYEGKTRYLDFNPSDTSIGKNAAGWPRMELPDLHKNPRFLAELLADAKTKIGQISQASAAVAKGIEDWRAKLDPDMTLAHLNGEILSQFKAVSHSDPLRPQIWKMISEFAANAELDFDRTTGQFVQKPDQGAAA